MSKEKKNKKEKLVERIERTIKRSEKIKRDYEQIKEITLKMQQNPDYQLSKDEQRLLNRAIKTALPKGIKTAGPKDR